MKLFHCPRCGSAVPFDAMRCASCDALLGYLPEDRDVVDLHRTGRPETFTVGQVPTERWRCLNAAWGCSWVLDAGSPTEWCASCRLTHGRPDAGDVVAMEAWSTTEAAKRRLLHHLATLGLPVVGRSPAHPRGLVFELVHVPGAPAVTGHLDGVVTIDLTEADDAHREHLRHVFGEGARTVLGHLRHEMGHYYWPSLVEAPDRLAAFRALFGDERTDYDRSLRDHRLDPADAWDHDEHITAYASAHPAEDWAETFAHHLLITDAVETMHAQGLARDVHSETFADQVASWQASAVALNAVAGALGAPALYPFTFTPRVLEKLAFVDRCIRG